MNITDQEASLWNRICDFTLEDPAASFSFTQRLARDNHWSLPFATRVVEEYKRFMFLAVVCDHVVSPSDAVDQVWHLHLVYTRSYWDEFCGEVLQHPIHHGPTRGGKTETTKFVDLYDKTKRSYFDKFGVEPPVEIWPSSEIRFDRSDRKHWISRKDYWIIRKPDFSKLLTNDSIPLGLAALVPATLFAWSPFDLSGPSFLVFYGVLTTIVAGLAIVLQRVFASDGSQWQLEQTRFQLTPNHLAFLASNENGVLKSAVCELLVGGQASALRQQLQYKKSQSGNHLSPIATAIQMKLNTERSINYQQIREAASVPLARINSDLTRVGLIQSRVKRHVLNWMSILMMAGVFWLGAARVVQGATNNRPVGFLILEMLALIGLTFLVILCVPYKTKAGREVLKQQQKKARKIKNKKLETNPSGQELGYIVAALGTDALIGTAFGSYSKDIQHVLSSPISTGGGGDSSSFGAGCGGGGCGGGCGGCGG